jgi:hypothetical protein
LPKGKETTRWFETAVKSFIDQVESRRSFMDDAQDYIVGAMLYEHDGLEVQDKTSTSSYFTKKVLGEYMTRANLLSSDVDMIPYKVQNQALSQLRGMLIAFGRKQPKVSC